ncbi:hypothetical protein C9374_013432 [Naegleria lovaniensis]|uniref:Guanylate cyclase domain-containing protein n=1 Tax=Naegleria lovaniensis TaxID=51637 RepID=A0AA88H267_NAELO|nr:uncharacterized protein C9374_013432 [Naegleria lovaniensis]KAG2391947.1 hypothetical protein C9374_013432 [Naegleria lovaniensis]
MSQPISASDRSRPYASNKVLPDPQQHDDDTVLISTTPGAEREIHQRSHDDDYLFTKATSTRVKPISSATTSRENSRVGWLAKSLTQKLVKGLGSTTSVNTVHELIDDFTIENDFVARSKTFSGSIVSSSTSNFEELSNNNSICIHCSFRCLLVSTMLIMIIVPIITLVLLSIGFSLLAANDVKMQVITQSFRRAESYISDFLWVCMEATYAQKNAIYKMYFMNESGININNDNSNIYSPQGVENLQKILAVSHKQYIGKIYLVDFTRSTGDYIYVDTGYQVMEPIENETETMFEPRQEVFQMLQPDNETSLSSTFYFTQLGKRRTVVWEEPTSKWDPRDYEFYALSQVYDEALVPLDVQWQGETIEQRVYTCFQANIYSPYDSQFVGVTSINVNIEYLANFVRSFYVSPRSFVAIIEMFSREDGIHKRVVGFKNASSIAIYDSSLEFEYRIAEASEIADPLLKYVVINVLPSNISGYASYHDVSYSDAHIQTFVFEGENYIVSHGVANGTAALNTQWLVAVVAPETDFTSNVSMLAGINVGVSILCLIASLFFSFIFSRAVSKPLTYFSSESKAISNLEINKGKPFHSSIKELLELSTAFENMKMALRCFKKFVPSELVRDMLQKGNEISLGGKLVNNLTIFFSDIENFTTWSEELEPQILIKQLTEYFHVFTEEIIFEKGTLDKYIGDSVMSFWGAPQPSTISGIRACKAALRCQVRMAELRKKWAKERKPLLRCRIGIHSGSCIVGNFGSRWRLNYTIIGDSVNLASRLEGTNKFYNTQIIVSEDTYLRPYVAEQLEFRKIDKISVKGKSIGCIIYELLGRKKELPPIATILSEESAEITRDQRPLPLADEELLQMRPFYDEALNHYFNGNFVDAALQFDELWRRIRR